MDNQNNGVNLQKENTVELPAGEVMAESYPNASLNTAAAPTFPANSYGYANPPVYPANTSTAVQTPAESNMKFCKFCAAQIPVDAVLCTSCGRQVEQLQGANPSQQPQIVINNANSNVNTAVGGVPHGKEKNKWVCLALWWFLGLVGGHKFYEGKIGTGLLYMFTVGGFVIGWFIDLFGILNKPNPYYV